MHEHTTDSLGHSAKLRSDVGAVEYIEDNYEPSDRLAIVARRSMRHEAIQRLATAEKIASPEFQAWLRYKNSRGFDIYISQNSLRRGARTRTKGDIERIRHVYVDLDRSGDEALKRIQANEHVPEPNYVINTSPDKYQVIWKVERVTPNDAENLQRAMVEKFDGDPAATDSTRVLRLPGFNNKKYEQDYLVTAQSGSRETYSLGHFRLPEDERQHFGREQEKRPMHGARLGEISQSERDWNYARRHLAGGVDPERVIQSIAHIRHDKDNPEYYSRQTVTRAYASVALGRGDNPADVQQRVAELSTHQWNPESYARHTVSEMQGRTAQRTSEPEQRERR
jgi:hypothetical protein